MSQTAHFVRNSIHTPTIAHVARSCKRITQATPEGRPPSIFQCRRQFNMTVTASKLACHTPVRSHLPCKRFSLFPIGCAGNPAMPVPAQKQKDKGGERAWDGGINAIQRTDTKNVLLLFVSRRLQALAKVLNEPDPMEVAGFNFEAMLQAIENMAPSEALHYDHTALRGLYAKYEGSLSPDDAQKVSTWEQTNAGAAVIGQMRAVLSTGWREVPAVIFGDSASTNHFNKSKHTMIAYCNRWLAESDPERKLGKIKDLIQSGHDINDWLNEFEKNKDTLFPATEVYSYEMTC